MTAKLSGYNQIYDTNLGSRVISTTKGNIRYSIKESADSIKLFKLLADQKGTGIGNDLVQSLKSYSDVTGKTLIINTPNKFWDRYDWLKKMSNGRDLEYNPKAPQVGKAAQFETIKKLNPMTNEYNTGIRSVDDIKTYKEAFDDPESFVYPDYSKADAQKALTSGKVTIYSSKPLDSNNGQFVTPSKMQASDYAGSGKVYSKKVNIKDVAWINGDEGQLTGSGITAQANKPTLPVKPIYENVPKSYLQPKGPKAELPLNAKERGFVSSVKTSQEVSDDVRSAISGSYDIKSNQVLVNNADKLTKNTNKAIATVNEQLAKPMGTLSDQEVANAIVLAKKLDANKNMDAALNIYDQLSQHLTEAGRQVQAASLLSRKTPEGLLFSAQRTLKKANVEITPAIKKELQTNIAAIKKTVIGSEERNMAIAKMQKNLVSHIPQRTLDNIVSVWKAGLLSGVKTQGGNFFSNATFGTLKLTSNPISTAADILMSKFTGKRSFALTGKGLASGGVEGAKRGVFTLRTGIDTRDIAAGANKFDQVAEINFNNKVVQKLIGTPSNLVFRGMSAADQPFYFAALKNSMYNQALAEAKTQGIKGTALKEYVSKTLANPSSNVLQIAKNEADKAVLGFDTVLSKVVSAAHKGIENANISPVGKSMANATINVIAPFTRVPSAFLSRTVDYTPFGPIKTIIGQISRKQFNQRALAQSIGEGVTGTGLIVLGSQLAHANLLSGEYPKNDQKEQARWKAEGITPNSVKIGNTWVSLNYLGPLGLLFGAGKNFVDAQKEGGTPAEIATSVVAGFGSGLLQQSFLQGLSGFINALNEPGRFADNYIKGFAGSVVPAWINDIGNLTDQYKRKATTASEAAMARIPGLRQTLQPQTDVFGNKLLQGGIQTLNPLKPSPVIGTTVTGELDRLKSINPDYDVWPTPVNKKDFFGKGTELDKKQLNDVNAELGAQIQDAWTRTIATADYQNKNDSDKADLLSKVKKQVIEDYKVNNDTKYGMEYTPKEKAQAKIAKYKKTLPKPKKWSKKGRKAKVAIPKAPRLKAIKVSVPKARKVSFKQPTPTKARKSIKIKTG